MKNWSPTPVTISVLNAGIDADLNLGATYKLKADHIAESTGAHGIVHDNIVKVDHIAEKTGTHGIVTDNLLAPAVGATLAAGQVLKTDHIGETTGAHGIVTDNLLAPAVGATLAAGQVLKTDHIGETTGAHNIVLDNTTDTHDKLSGLTDDDHARYFDKDGSKAITDMYIKRSVNNSYLILVGGTARPSGGELFVVGKDTVGTIPGGGGMNVVNELGTNYINMWQVRGNTNTPFLDMLSHRIAYVADPTSAQDASTKKYVDVRLPAGVIMLWSGAIAAIPVGWVLCDGGAGTPNLRDMFVVGAGTTYAVGATGGEATHALTEAELAAHHHTYTKVNFNANTGGTTAGGYVSPSVVDTGDAGSGTAHENRPPYYALAYIMKT